MNKYELICQIAKSSGLTKAAAERTLNVTLETITQALAKEECISLIGFGAFSVSKRAATIGRNPRTGSEIKIAEKKIVKFKVGKKLKDAVCLNGKKIKAQCGCGGKTSRTMTKAVNMG